VIVDCSPAKKSMAAESIPKELGNHGTGLRNREFGVVRNPGAVGPGRTLSRRAHHTVGVSDAQLIGVMCALSTIYGNGHSVGDRSSEKEEAPESRGFSVSGQKASPILGR
jgi:hypothetical protein